MSAHPDRKPGHLYVVLSVNRDPARRYLEFDRTEGHRGKECEPKWITERDGYRLLEFPDPEAHAAALDRITHLEAERTEAERQRDVLRAEIEEMGPAEEASLLAAAQAEVERLTALTPDIVNHQDECVIPALEAKVAALEAERDAMEHAAQAADDEAVRATAVAESATYIKRKSVEAMVKSESALAAALDALEELPAVLRRECTVCAGTGQDGPDECEYCGRPGNTVRLHARAVLTANNRSPR